MQLTPAFVCVCAAVIAGCGTGRETALEPGAPPSSSAPKIPKINAPPADSISPDRLGLLKKYVDNLNWVRTEFSRLNPASATIPPMCPPARFTVKARDGSSVALLKLPPGYGDVEFITNKFRMLSVVDKTIMEPDTPMHKSEIERFARHKAMIATLGGSEWGAPMMAEVSEGVSDACEAASVVYHASGELPRLKKHGIKILFVIAANTLRLIQKIHSLGLCLGALDPNLTMFDEATYTIRWRLLVNASPWVDINNGKHLPQSESPIFLSKWEAVYAGPWHYQKNLNMSRRDDIAGIAIALIYMLDSDSIKHPQEVRDFNRYARHMEYTETPKYEQWIQVFEQAVAGNSNSLIPSN